MEAGKVGGGAVAEAAGTCRGARGPASCGGRPRRWLAGRAGPERALGFFVAELAAILLDAITDKDPLVQEQVCGALCALGEAAPEEVLGACEEYLRQHEKVVLAQRGRARGWRL